MEVINKDKNKRNFILWDFLGDEEFSNEKGSKVLSQETIKNEKSSYQKKSTFGEN